MVLSKRTYMWFYDHVHSHYYDVVMKYCFLPFGGETKCRDELLDPVEYTSHVYVHGRDCREIPL